MKNNNLLKRVSDLGFPLFEVEEDKKVNLTLADMVKTKDLRLWEGFPVVLANSAEKGLFDYEKVNLYLKEPVDKSCLAELLALSLALYKFFNLKFTWASKLYKSLKNDKKQLFEDFLDKLKDANELKVSGYIMSTHRLKEVFTNYFSQSQVRLSELVSVKNELGLEYALSQVFSPKQKELFFKKLKKEKLTKTEKEYFSRTVKKKILALANMELHSLSQKLLE
ncbi:MAG: hypothetical protein Q8N76_01440 [Candidatus Omnitrophota bacterium]|nr:hypothetical protein [Candidatus Omnitrophota bacterium]